MITTLSLTGKKKQNILNLAGDRTTNESIISIEIKQIKILILNSLVIPLLSKQWETLNQNLICLDKVKRKINNYYEKYKLDDLLIYKELIKAIEIIMCEHKQLEDLENKLYNPTRKSSSLNFSTMIYKTSMIKLKPEYEIYNLILGNPNVKLQEKYNEEIIKTIEQLLSVDNITFNAIKEVVTKKYLNYK